MRLISWQKWSYLRLTINYGVRFLIISLLLFLGNTFFLTNPAKAQTIVPATLPPATVGSAYSVQLLVVPAQPLPHNWVIFSGALPPGLSLAAATGVISGTPLSAGTFTFVVQLTAGPPPPPPQTIIQQGYYIVVHPRPITILTTSLADATEGSIYSGTILAEGGTPPYTWSIIGGALPSGLTFDAARGTISGTPTRGTAGSYSITVRVTDSSFPVLSAQRSFTITVKKGFYDAIITIGSNLLAGETKVLVDGREVAKLAGGQSKRLSFRLGTRHTVAVEREVLHPTRPDIKFKADKDIITIDEFSPTAIFNYDIYYQLSVTSAYGETEGSGWYPAGTAAKWRVSPSEVPMSGFFGFLKGKLKPHAAEGIEIMNAPKNINVAWGADYTMPILFLSMLFLLLGVAGFLVYRHFYPPAPKPVIAPVPSPAPPTIVVVGEPRSRTPLEITKEQLVEQFRQLLEKYEKEVKGTVTEAVPETQLAPGTLKLAPPKEVPLICSYTTRNLIRTVVGNWRKVEERIIPPDDRAAQKEIIIYTVWARDIYNEWEIFTCSLPQGHSGSHRVTSKKVYSLQSTITEEKTYSPKQKITPPKPHFTDELPAVEVAHHQIITIDSISSPAQAVSPDEIIPPDQPSQR